MTFKKHLMEHFHIELTQNCNAACPQCARNICGGLTSPYLNSTEISIDQFRSILPESILNDHVKSISFGGNYGDPSLAKDLHKIITYIQQVNEKITIDIETNGGIQNTSWWYELGTLLGDNKGYCSFSIDGLEDTNHIHRRNVSWDKLINNVNAFIKAGGNARWNFLVFKHNEHQVNKAKVLASKLGFRSFRIKKTARMHVQPKDTHAPHIAVFDKKGGFEYTIELPKKTKYLNEKYKQFSDLPESKIENKFLDLNNLEYESLSTEELNYINTSEISCDSLNKNTLYISAEGRLFPCCFLAWPISYAQKGDIVNQTQSLFKNMESNSLYKNPIEVILNSELFSTIEKKWTSKSKLSICSLSCSKCSKNTSLNTKTL